MILSVAIAAHPKRTNFAEYLARQLNCTSTIVWDLEDNEWDTHYRAWQLGLNSEFSHHLVLQDDAVPCKDLIPALEKALPTLPENAITSLYFGKAQNHPKIVRAVNRANETGAGWILTTGTWWGVGIIIPTGLIAPMLEFCSRRREVYDRRLSIWCEHGPDGPYPVYYPWPSLVDHLDIESLVIPGRPPGRKAFQFIGADHSALEWDYTKPAVPCGRVMGKYIKLGKDRIG